MAGHCAGLAIRIPAGDDHAIKEAGHLGGIEYLDVHRLGVLKCVDNEALLFLDVHREWVLGAGWPPPEYRWWVRSEEHTSELQSLMRSSYAVFCLTKKQQNDNS